MISKDKQTGKDMLLDFLRESVQKDWLPGFAAAFVSAEGVERFTEGSQSLVPHVETLQEDAVFDVASLTKVMVTTTLVLQLAAEKQIQLERPVQDYLSGFRHPHVTVADLMLHRSGLPAGLPVGEGMSVSEFRQAVLECPVGEKGTTLYSDIGFILLGWLLEERSGQSLKRLGEERIVRPLRLQNSGYTLQRPEARFVPTERRAAKIRRGEVHDSKAAFLGGVSGHAGWFATLDDCVLFLKGLLHSDTAAAVFPAVYLDWMEQWATDGRTLGWEWRESEQGDAYLYHTGFTGVFMYVNTRTRQGGVVLTNSIHPNRDNPYKEQRNRLMAELFSAAKV